VERSWTEPDADEEKEVVVEADTKAAHV